MRTYKPERACLHPLHGRLFLCTVRGMADSLSRTVTVGESLKLAIIQSEARRRANGRYQVRKLQGIWCLIAPSGLVLLTGEHKEMRAWAFFIVKFAPHTVRPF